MKIFYIAAEVDPFVKTGGLGDVAGSLPKVLAAKGEQVTVVMPKYNLIAVRYRNAMEHVYDGMITLAWRRKYIGLDKLRIDGVDYYFIDNQEYFGRDSLYGYGDDAERFAFFCRAALEMIPQMGHWPDVIHTNDWHTALVNVYLKLYYRDDPRYASIRTMFTIHNLKYQGIFGRDVLSNVCGIDSRYFENGDFEFNGAANFMKAGIIYADMLTTVSKTYAREIQYDFFGEGLAGLLRSRSDDLYGIVNGIDTKAYDPETDKMLVKPYDYKTIEGKIDNKVALQEQLGLSIRRDVPMMAVVSRLVETKGIDLMIRILDELLRIEEVQLVVLGSGDGYYEDWFRGLAWRWHNRVSVTIGFSNELAHRIYASADLFLMPSRYEPCGIGQMIAMRYGAAPVVRATGGLRDTVIPYHRLTGTGTGYTFENYNAHEFLHQLQAAIAISRDVGYGRAVAENAMQADHSWDKSAAEYIDLYGKIVRR